MCVRMLSYKYDENTPLFHAVVHSWSNSSELDNSEQLCLAAIMLVCVWCHVLCICDDACIFQVELVDNKYSSCIPTVAISYLKKDHR